MRTMILSMSALALVACQGGSGGGHVSGEREAKPGSGAKAVAEPAAKQGQAKPEAGSAEAGAKAAAQAKADTPSEAGMSPEEKEFRELYAEFEPKLEKATVAYNLAWWKAALSGDQKDFDESARLELELKKLHSDRATYAKLERLRASGKVSDPIMRRALEVMYLSFKENQLDEAVMKELVDEAAALEHTFNTYRGEVDGEEVTSNRIREVLGSSNDSQERRKYWEASKAIGPKIASRLKALVVKRNAAARSLGYRNYYEMQLRLGEQDPAQIARIYEEVDRLTAKPFLEMKARLDARLAKRFGVKVEDLRPWHYSDVFFQESPGVDGLDLDSAFAKTDPKVPVVAFYKGIGLPVVDEILARSDLYERKGKVEHAFCTDIDRKGDVRILTNLKNDERWTGTLLHELGHGVYDAHIDRSLPFILRTAAHAFVTEGVAELFGTLTRDPEWLAVYTDLPPATREKLASLARQENRMDQLVFARWTLVMVNFERALYENPEQDLNALWWDMVERYQHLHRPDDMAGRQDWATKIHIVIVPAYYHNYLLGRMYAAQLRSRLAKVVPAAVVEGGRLHMAGHPEIGAYLVQSVFRPGLRYRWDELVERSTGEPLSPRAFVEQL